MRTIVIVLGMVLSGLMALPLSAQQLPVGEGITPPGKDYTLYPAEDVDTGLLKAALEKCNLQPYYDEDYRVIMEFDDGTFVALEPAGEGITQMKKLPNTFILNSRGFILEQVKSGK